MVISVGVGMGRIWGLKSNPACYRSDGRGLSKALDPRRR